MLDTAVDTAALRAAPGTGRRGDRHQVDHFHARRHAMTKPLTTLALLLAMGLTAAAGAAPALADGCPNAALREGVSRSLPNCRAYELVSPDANHASNTAPAGRTSADGNTMAYQLIDAPENAQSATVFNMVRASRDPKLGWRGVSTSPPVPGPEGVYAGFIPRGLSADFSSLFVYTDQQLTPDAPSGQNAFVGRPDGTYRLVTTVASQLYSFSHTYPSADFVYGNADFSRVYFLPGVAQDPADLGSPYSWTEATGPRLVGILPDGTPAPGAFLAGGVLQPVSSSGKYAVFSANGGLFVRVNDSTTIAIGATQRTVDPDLNPAAPISGQGITSDGSRILFTSRSELTNDANTGRSGGVATDAGNDLYSYDMVTGTLKDLTVATDAADAATGANVESVYRASSDGSFIYFTARGNLAPGATPGHRSLYRWHDDQIEFVANADGITGIDGGQISTSMTPDGRHFAFASTDRLTGYDNTDPVTGLPHFEVFKASVGSALECVSCRRDSSRPTGDSYLPEYFGLAGAGIRDMSDDGRRVFFHSRDAVTPDASSGLQQVYQYEEGRISPISRPDGSAAAVFLDASASGDDVFFSTYDDLVPYRNSGDQGVFDARVNGGIPVADDGRCRSLACQEPATPAAAVAVAASVDFVGDGNVTDDAADPAGTSKVTVSKVKTITGAAGTVKVRVPGKGRLMVSGSGVQTKRSSLSKAQMVSVRVALTSKAAKSLRKKRSFKTKVKVAFTDSGGTVSTATLSLTFKPAKVASARKGR
jgi:hypothetical protein